MQMSNHYTLETNNIFCQLHCNLKINLKIIKDPHTHKSGSTQHPIMHISGDSNEKLTGRLQQHISTVLGKLVLKIRNFFFTKFYNKSLIGLLR